MPECFLSVTIIITKVYFLIALFFIKCCICSNCVQDSEVLISFHTKEDETCSFVCYVIEPALAGDICGLSLQNTLIYSSRDYTPSLSLSILYYHMGINVIQSKTVFFTFCTMMNLMSLYIFIFEVPAIHLIVNRC